MNYSIFTDTMVDVNWKEIEEKGKRNVPVLFPLGVIEEHGPHLPYGTDIYMSYAICKKIKAMIDAQGGECLIAPPYYWGINHCTGSFPGTFSLKPETMKLVLIEILENLHQFGFDKVYCVNQHGDALHVKTIIDAIQTANEKFNMNIRLLLEPFDLYQYGLSGKEDYILLDEAEFAPDLFTEDDAEEKGLFDIHAGALETAAMECFYPHAVCKETVNQLQSYSLTENSLNVWLAGGKDVQEVVPLGYAGNPARYEKKIATAKTIFEGLAAYCAKRIMEDSVVKRVGCEDNK